MAFLQTQTRSSENPNLTRKNYHVPCHTSSTCPGEIRTWDLVYGERACDTLQLWPNFMHHLAFIPRVSLLTWCLVMSYLGPGVCCFSFYCGYHATLERTWYLGRSYHSQSAVLKKSSLLNPKKQVVHSVLPSSLLVSMNDLLPLISVELSSVRKFCSDSTLYLKWINETQPQGWVEVLFKRTMSGSTSIFG